MPQLIAVLCFLLGGIASARVWTNGDGANVEGDIVAARETEIDLKLQDGSIVTVPRKIISFDDEQFVVEWIKHNGADLSKGSPSGKKAQVTLGGAQGEWDKPWPVSVGLAKPVIVATEKEEGGSNIYRSDHFIFESMVPLLPAELNALAREMELCLSSLAALPLNLQLASHPRRKYTVRVFFDKKWYADAGGVAGRTFTAKPTHFLVLLERSSKGNPRNLEKLNAMHELTNWVTQFSDSDFWMNEGLALYMELLPRSEGKVVFEGDLNRVARSIPSSYRKGRKVLPPLNGIINRNAGKDPQAALIVSTFFFRLDGDGKRIKAYVKALQRGEKDLAVLEKIILNGQSWTDLEKEIAKAWEGRMTPVFAK